MAERDVRQPHSDTGSAPMAEWLGSYVNDVWTKPQDHLLEIGITGIAASAGLAQVTRIGLRAFTARGAALPEVALSPAPLEPMMGAKALKNAVASVRNLSFEIDSGFSTLVGKIGPNGERVLVTADNNAFALRSLKGTPSDKVYAHELVLSGSGDKFIARFLIDSKHKNTWSTVDNPVWPAGKSGIWANLKNAGIQTHPLPNAPMKLEFTDKMSHLEIASVSGKRFNIALDAALDGRGKAIGQTAISNRVSSIRVEGHSAVSNARGRIHVHDPELKIDRALKYPEVQPGGTLRIYHDPEATILPELTSDMRHMSKEGLLPHV